MWGDVGVVWGAHLGGSFSGCGVMWVWCDVSVVWGAHLNWVGALVGAA